MVLWIMGARRHGQKGALAPSFLWKCKVFCLH